MSTTLAKCTVCGVITDMFDTYGSNFLRDEYPRECICVCSTPCFETAEEKIGSGEWDTPKLRKAHGGYCHDISNPRKGYDAQPTQEELTKQLLENQKP